MRRCLAIVLLALLPLQFSWAAVAVYCGHESAVRAAHFGHHTHQHPADAGADAADKSKKAEAASAAKKADAGSSMHGQHPDCGQCQGCTAVLPLPADTLPPADLAAAPRAAATCHARTLAPLPPERPQWAARA